MSLTPARFSCSYSPAHTRLLAALAWLVLMAMTAQFWLGGTGVGVTMVLATRWLRALRDQIGHRQVLTLEQDTLHQVWALPGVLCIERGRSGRLWLFADELDAPVWAALRRFLKLSLPRQALGLNISR